MSLRSVARERELIDEANALLAKFGLAGDALAVTETLPYGKQRLLEVALAFALRPQLLLLDEPAAGLSAEEIRRLGALVVEMAKNGTGVLLVEHHADLIFDICHHVTVLNLGKKLAAGTPAEIRSHREVVSAYLGG